MAKARPLYRFARFLVWALLKPFFGFRLTGCEHIPAEGPVIITANHRSLLDPIMLSIVTKRPIHYMAKAELFAFKPFGAALRRVYAFPVSRDSADLQSIKHALKVLRDGQVLGVFPEGKRVADVEMGAFKNGVSMLALSSGAPVVPIYMAGRRRFRGHLEARAGEPIHLPKPLGKRAGAVELSAATNIIRDAIEALRRPGDE